MTKKKTKTESVQHTTRNYGFMNTPITPQMQDVIDAAHKPVSADPSIIGRYANAEADIKRSYNDPFGAYTTPDVQGKAYRSQITGLHAQRDMAMRSDYHDAQETSFGRQLAAAGLTMPQLVDTGSDSSGTQSTVQSGGLGMALLQTGLTAAAAF